MKVLPPEGIVVHMLVLPLSPPRNRFPVRAPLPTCYRGDSSTQVPLYSLASAPPGRVFAFTPSISHSEPSTLEGTLLLFNSSVRVIFDIR